jgi:hypothetical protein
MPCSCRRTTAYVIQKGAVVRPQQKISPRVTAAAAGMAQVPPVSHKSNDKSQQVLAQLAGGKGINRTLLSLYLCAEQAYFLVYVVAQEPLAWLQEWFASDQACDNHDADVRHQGADTLDVSCHFSVSVCLVLLREALYASNCCLGWAQGAGVSSGHINSGINLSMT